MAHKYSIKYQDKYNLMPSLLPQTALKVRTSGCSPAMPQEVTHLRRDFTGDNLLSKEPLPNSRKHWPSQTGICASMSFCVLLTAQQNGPTQCWVLPKEIRLSTKHENTHKEHKWQNQKYLLFLDFTAMWHLKQHFEHYKFVCRCSKLDEGSASWIPVIPAHPSTSTT